LGARVGAGWHSRTGGGGTTATQRIVIIGGGFAGVTLAQHLQRRASAAEVLLLSRENHMVFTPMLAEVAGRMVAPEHIVVPGRHMLRPEQWLTATVTHVDLEHRTVYYVSAQGASGSLTYDHLVVACGAAVDLDHVAGMAAYAYPLKGLGDALVLTNDILARFEAAAAITDPGEHARLLAAVVIGGGFSGVEVAGALSDLVQGAVRYYPQLGAHRPQITILHRGDALLPELNAPSLSAFALARLRARGVDVRLRSEAREITGTGAYLTSGERIDAATVVCTVGTTANALVRGLGLPLERGRIVTDPDMRVRGTANVWALGDCALVPNAHDGRPCPTTAQFATRQAGVLATNLLAAMRGAPTRPFRFRPLGMLASLGHRNAVAEILGIRLSGLPAWLAWRSVYLGKLPGVRRKVQVAVDWAWRTLFPPSIVELPIARTGPLGRAHYAAGEYVFHKGDAADRFFVIEHGEAGIYLDERRPPLALLTVGYVFGETAVLAPDRPRPVSAKAETPLSVAWLGGEDLLRLGPALAIERGARKIYGALSALTDRMAEFGRAPVSGAMSRPPHTLSPALGVEEALARFTDGQPGYPVVDEQGALLGYCGVAEVYGALAGRSAPEMLVGDIMRRDPPVLVEDRTMAEAAVLLGRREELLMVTAADGSGKMIGVLTRLDLLRSLFTFVRRNNPARSTSWSDGVTR
jgi:NADH:ubiquinone reductase (H+-translocating)